MAWTHYISAVQASSNGDTTVLVDLAVAVVQLCEASSKALADARQSGMVPQDGSLGGALAGGEMPHVQVLYLALFMC